MAHNLRPRGRQTISPGRSASILYFKLPIQRLFRAQASLLNPAQGLRGTLIRLGQTLIITAGAGWVQREAGPVEEVHPGDVVWFPPHEKHWHGATPTTAMTHIAIQEKLDGKVVDWLEKVTDEQYRK